MLWVQPQGLIWTQKSGKFGEAAGEGQGREERDEGEQPGWSWGPVCGRKGGWMGMCAQQ